MILARTQENLIKYVGWNHLTIGEIANIVHICSESYKISCCNPNVFLANRLLFRSTTLLNNPSCVLTGKHLCHQEWWWRRSQQNGCPEGRGRLPESLWRTKGTEVGLSEMVILLFPQAGNWWWTMGFWWTSCTLVSGKKSSNRCAMVNSWMMTTIFLGDSDQATLNPSKRWQIKKDSQDGWRCRIQCFNML